MNYACILLMILGLVTAIVGLYISRGHGELLKPYNTVKNKSQINKAGKIAALVGLIIFVVFLIIYLITM